MIVNGGAFRNLVWSFSGLSLSTLLLFLLIFFLILLGFGFAALFFAIAIFHIFLTHPLYSPSYIDSEELLGIAAMRLYLVRPGYLLDGVLEGLP